MDKPWLTSYPSGIPETVDTRGHRFHTDREIIVTHAAKYAEILFEQGKVVADFGRRRAMIGG